jgi:hypothetical protein
MALHTLTETEQRQFLPTAKQMDDSPAGTSIAFYLKARPAPHSLGRTASLYFYHGFSSDFYVREEAEHYSCDMFTAQGTLTFRYAEGSEVHWFCTPLNDRKPQIANIIQRNHFPCPDIAGMTSDLKAFLSRHTTGDDRTTIERAERDTLKIHWASGADIGEMRIIASIEKKEPDWVSKIKAELRSAKPTTLAAREFTFLEISKRLTADSWVERKVALGDLAKVAREGAFPLPKDKSLISRASTTNGGKWLLLEVQLCAKPVELLMYRFDAGANPNLTIDRTFTKEMVESKQDWGAWKFLLVREGGRLTKYCVNPRGLIIRVVKEHDECEGELRGFVESLHEEE